MEINWFTFFAQIVNFLILVFVLQKLLYKPIVQAMERREQTIRDHLQSAEKQQQQAEQEMAHYQQMQAEFASQKAELLAQVRLEVAQIREQLLQEVENESVIARSQWQASLKRQKSVFLQEVRHRTIQQLQAIARLVLQDLAETSLEEQISQIFLKKLQNLDERDRFDLVSPLTKISNNDKQIALTVVSTFDLSGEIKAQIANILQNYFNQANLGEIALDYEIQPDLVCGIELRGIGYKLTWSIEAYLDSLSENLDAALAEEIGVTENG